MSRQAPKLHFFRVKDNQAKVGLICDIVQRTSQKNKKLLLHVPNLEAARYIDDLLWNISDVSFIPHAIIQVPSKEWIGITTELSQNLNQAPCLLNLCPQICSIPDQFEEIFELFDETHPQKAASSQLKLDSYRMKGFTVLYDSVA